MCWNGPTLAPINLVEGVSHEVSGLNLPVLACYLAPYPFMSLVEANDSS